MSIGGACKLAVVPLVSLSEAFNQEPENFEDSAASNTSQTARYIAYLIHIIMFIGAGYLAWTCSASETGLLRGLYTVLAALFNGFYLIYYLIYRIIMGNACK